jgi:hypothetical protein
MSRLLLPRLLLPPLPWRHRLQCACSSPWVLMVLTRTAARNIALVVVRSGVSLSNRLRAGRLRPSPGGRLAGADYLFALSRRGGFVVMRNGACFGRLYVLQPLIFAQR